jgi:hypothetical protein
LRRDLDFPVSIRELQIAEFCQRQLLEALAGRQPTTYAAISEIADTLAPLAHAILSPT